MRKKFYDTNALKQRAYRNRKKGDEGSNVTPENISVTRIYGAGAAVTAAADEWFESARPGYWNFSDKFFTRKCWKCGEKFETRLEMNKFCSPACKEEFLDDASRSGRMKRG